MCVFVATQFFTTNKYIIVNWRAINDANTSPDVEHT